jgi:uncharacterized repeat protein (TIGR02543 family)
MTHSPRPRRFTRIFTSVALVAGFIALAPVATSRAAVVSDTNNICPLTVTSGGVTVNSSSVAVTVAGNNCVIQFLAVGTYTVTIPSTVNSVNYLVVGGGGGGASGGGGGGGVLQGSNYSVTPSSTYSVTVGAGGVAGSGGSNFQTNDPISTNGGNSVFSTFTALGGGLGGQGSKSNVAGTGGSGGGAHYDCTSASCAGSGTVGQGNNGSISTHPGYGGGAGGGGAGGAGGNTILTYIGGNGGAGIQSSITGTPTYYGGGGGGGVNNNDNQYVYVNASGSATLNGSTPITGGGGSGGVGGGGRGSSYGYSGGSRGAYANATAGVANTGGGGGGTDPEDLGAGAGGSGVVILSYVASVNQRTITFNSNINSPTTTTQLVTSGLSTQLAGNTFTAAGYVFTGWDTQSGGGGTTYANLANITTTTDTTLYAQWIAGVNHAVTFAANSGSGTMAAQVAGVATNLTPNAFTRSGYTFSGWATQSGGGGYTYSDQGTYSFAADTTLYAQWTVVATTYTVSFFGNGADGGGTNSQSASTATPLTLNGLTRTGYNFLGWDTNYQANSATYVDGQSYSFAASISLYAIWVQQGPQHTITFDSNSATSGSMSAQQATSSTVLSSNGFSKTGYTFLNWNTLANGNGTSYSSSYAYSFAASITLHAIWSQNLTITYSGNLNSGGTAPTSQSYYIGGPSVTIAGNSGALFKTGYILTGWNTASGGGGTSYALGQVNAIVSGSPTLYAQWTGATYAVQYNGNQNSSGSAPNSQSYVYGGATITLATNSGSLFRTGYTFSGWNSQPDGSGTAYSVSATGVSVASDTVLFAYWVALPLNFTVSGVGIYRAVNTLTATPPSSGKVSFFANGKAIPGCKGVQTTGSSGSYSATCGWRPSAHGTNIIYATIISSGTTTRSLPLTVNVSARAGNR